MLFAYYLSHLFLFLCCVLLHLWTMACDLCCQGLKTFSYISSSFCHCCCFYRQRITPISIIHHSQNGSAFLFVLKFNSKSSTFPMTKYPIIFGLLSQEEMCFTFWVISCRSTCGKEHVDYGPALEEGALRETRSEVRTSNTSGIPIPGELST